MNFANRLKGNIKKVPFQDDVVIHLKPMSLQATSDLQTKHTKIEKDDDGKSVPTINHFNLSIDTGYHSLVGWTGIDIDGVPFEYSEANKAEIFEDDLELCVFVVTEATLLKTESTKAFKADSKN